MSDYQVIENIKNVAKTTLPADGSVFLYGSRARGDAKAGADWDILILLNKSHIEKSDYDNVVFPFTYLGWELGEMIIPVIYTKEEWQASSYLPFYKNVERDKIEIV